MVETVLQDGSPYAVLVFLVVAFLRFLSTEGKANRESSEKQAEVIAKSLEGHSTTITGVQTALTNLRIEMTESRKDRQCQ